MFDWPSLLRARGVEFVTRGPNVRRGNLNVHCPWCGEADPSQHLGISLKGAGWGCWRNKAHRGKSRSRLIEALLRCFPDEARQLAGEEDFASTPTDEDFGDLVAEDLGLEPTAARPTSLQFPPEFKAMSLRSAGGIPFWEYLYRRGYSRGEADCIVDRYKLQYARTGEWASRLIIPVYGEHYKLLTWTGRTINSKAIPRYKSLATRLSVSPTTGCLLGLPLLWSAPNPRLLVVCEGPFDALRLTALGRELGIYGTCLFGLNASEKQALHLIALGRRFDRIGMCLDTDADMSILRLQDALRVAGVSQLEPLSVKDPGELNSQSGRSAIQSWLT